MRRQCKYKNNLDKSVKNGINTPWICTTCADFPGAASNYEPEPAAVFWTNLYKPGDGYTGGIYSTKESAEKCKAMGYGRTIKLVEAD